MNVWQLDKKKALEWFGVATAIIYSLLVASNTGYEVLGFFFTFGVGSVYRFLGLALQTQRDPIASIFLCHSGNYWYRQVALTRKKLSNFL